MPTSGEGPILKQMLLITCELETRLQHALHELSLMKETLFLAMQNSSYSSKPIGTPIPQLHWEQDSKTPGSRQSSTHMPEAWNSPPYLRW